MGAPGEAGAIQPVKVRPGSECCMAEGDDRDEAYTAICEGYGKPQGRSGVARLKRVDAFRLARPQPLVCME